MSGGGSDDRGGVGYGARVRGLIQASHPFPILMVVSLTALVGIMSSRGEPPWGRLALAVLAMLLSQLSIGWSNDFLDRRRDAVHQPDKPVPAGLVDPSILPWLVAASLMGSLAAGVALGTATLMLLAAGTACGFAYNVALKDTRWSWLAYVGGFALLPPFVWTALDLFETRFLWLYPIGAPLAVAAHIANTLPDIEGDAAAGARGVAVSLGRATALRALAVCLALPPFEVAFSGIFLAYDAVVLGATLALYAVLVAAAGLSYRSGDVRAGAERAFRLLAPAAVVLTAGWLAAL